jgi:predicted membrane channel-forming protein YqfA (hemolysin III family)
MSWLRETDGMDDARTVLTAFILTLVGFKVVTSIMVLYFFPSLHALVLVIALSSMWVIGGVIYGGIYSRVKLRLLRARAKRNKLLHQEWHVD